MRSLLSIKNLVVAYEKKPVLQDVSLTITPGEFIGLIGPNGAGKTTFLLAISGQFKPQEGQIECDGYDIYKNNYDYKRQIGFVHENPFFYAHLTVQEFLVFIARVKGVPRQNLISQVDAVLTGVRLTEERHKLTSQLSQGMRKKLALAAALLNSPKIVFLDEALNGIDVESAFYIKNLLLNFVKGGGTILLSTHILEVIEKICARVVVLKAGRILADLYAEKFKETQDIDLEKYVLSLLKN